MYPALKQESATQRDRRPGVYSEFMRSFAGAETQRHIVQFQRRCTTSFIVPGNACVGESHIPLTREPMQKSGIVLLCTPVRRFELIPHQTDTIVPVAA